MTNRTPKFSIITVVLNGKEHIARCINSLLVQSYDNYEYILIDGGSTDGTLNILTKYKSVIDILVSEKDNGLYDAINKGIKLATGDVIGLLHCDDQYFSDTLSIVAKQFSPYEILTGYSVRPDGTEYQLTFKTGKRFQKKKPLEKLKYVMALDHPAMFIPIDLFQTIGEYDVNLKIASDYKWTATAWTQGIEFKIIDQPLTIFAGGGLSDSNRIRASLENRRIQIELNLLPTYIANLYLLYRIIIRFTPQSFIYFMRSLVNSRPNY